MSGVRHRTVRPGSFRPSPGGFLALGEGRRRFDAARFSGWNGIGQIIVLLGCLLGEPPISQADSAAVLEVGKFSAESEAAAVPSGWLPLTFRKIEKRTAYALVKDDGTVVLKASSAGSASGLIKLVRIDPKEYPIVRWRWKVENLLRKSDIGRKDGDDYPARLYVTFNYDPEKVGFSRRAKYLAGRLLFGNIPVGTLNYIWDAKAPVGTMADNAYTDFAKMIVLRSGPHGVGTWVEEQRNVYEDYRQAFGEEPSMISGVGLMTDTDNTGESATAYYGDITFVQGGGRR